jgi:hypothetical protein
MAQPYCTGPCLSYLKFPGDTAVSFLGTTEHTPNIKFRPAFSPIFNDLAGQLIPYDLMFQSEEAFVFLDLTRWSETVRRRVSARLTLTRTAGGEGIDGPDDIGTFMMSEGQNPILYLAFPYSPLSPNISGIVGKASMNDLPAGYRFFQAVPIGPDDHNQLGTNPYKVLMPFHCIRTVTTSPLGFTLCDSDLSDLAGATIT